MLIILTLEKKSIFLAYGKLTLSLPICCGSSCSVCSNMKGNTTGFDNPDRCLCHCFFHIQTTFDQVQIKNYRPTQTHQIWTKLSEGLQTLQQKKYSFQICETFILTVIIQKRAISLLFFSCLDHMRTRSGQKLQYFREANLNPSKKETPLAVWRLLICCHEWHRTAAKNYSHEAGHGKCLTF